MRSENPAHGASSPGRGLMERWRRAFPVSRPFGILLAALLLPGGLLVLAWMLYCRLALRERRIPVSGAAPAPAARVLTSPAPQHGPPAGDARGATAERKH